MVYLDFTEMPIWQKAMDVAINIQRLTVGFPKNEDYGVTSQIRRAGLSISSNIAEGFGRNHIKDKINFYYYSRGSIMETRSQLIYCVNVEYLTKNDIKPLEDNLLEIALDLNKLIKSLQSKS